MTTFLRRLSGGVVALIAPALAAGSYLATRDRLPDPLPVHWNLHGEVDNTAHIGGFFAATLVLSVLLALAVFAAIYLARTPIAGRMLAALLAFGAWIAAGVWVTTAVVSAGATSAQDVALSWYMVVPLVGVPLVAGLAVWAVLPGQWQHPAAPAAPSPGLVFAPGEAVVWVDHAHVVWTRWIAILAAAGAVLAFFLAPPATVPLAVASVALALISEIVVRIDARGVHTMWGPFGWPRSRIPLGQITSAHHEDIRPLQWGGWGYRVSPRGVAAVIRRGPGLVVSRSGKPDYAVTIPHAAAGADVLGALLARERATS